MPPPLRLGRERARWPDPQQGPYVADTFWAEVDGRLECVGMMLSSFEDPAGNDPRPVGERLVPVTTSHLRGAPWGSLMERHREESPEVRLVFGMTPDERREAADRLTDAGVPIEEATLVDWVRVMPRQLQERVLGRYPERRPKQVSKGGRPPLYSEDDWLARALVYLHAQRTGRHPNRALADAFGVEISTARSWSAALRRKGLLRSAGVGRPSQEPQEGGS
jgi:hypothetical protein